MQRAMIILASMLSAALFAAAATAQSNRLELIQEGSGNVVNIDQSNAVNSSISLLTAPALAPLTTPAIGRPGQLPSGSPGTLPILSQNGNGNSIDILIEGMGGMARFSQNSPAQALSLANDGLISIQGDGTALLYQDGGGNHASVAVSGPGARGSITQVGSRNLGSLTVSGASAEGLLIQRGDGNIATGVEVGGAGARVLLMQVGDNLVSEGLVANSNAEAVTIVQRNLRR